LIPFSCSAFFSRDDIVERRLLAALNLGKAAWVEADRG
jgi:hypothetical protein